MSIPASARDGPLDLETRLPALQLAWLSTSWLKSDPPTEALELFISTVSTILCTCHAKTAHYMYDVLLLLSKVRVLLMATDLDLGVPVIPSASDDSPITISDSDADQLAQTVATMPYDQSVVSLYMYSLTLPLARAIPTELLLEKTSLSRLKLVLKNFASDVKWYKMGDCYLWGMIQCVIPAWLCCTLSKADNPWAIFSKTFKEDANAIGRPFVTQSAAELLDTLDNPLNISILLASLALELTDKPGNLSINSHIMYTISHTFPTLTVVSDYAIGSEQVRSTLGYTFNGVFYHHHNPYIVISEFFGALSSISSRTTYANARALCDSSAALQPDNPLNKYAAETE